jgi:Na+/melibiose symporter-like transporter
MHFYNRFLVLTRNLIYPMQMLMSIYELGCIVYCATELGNCNSYAEHRYILLIYTKNCIYSMLLLAGKILKWRVIADVKYDTGKCRE